MKVKYIGDTGWLDGCTFGEDYEVSQCEGRPEKYIVQKNDLGGTSNLFKEKFMEVEERDDEE